MIGAAPPDVSSRRNTLGFWILAVAVIAFVAGICAQPAQIVDLYWQMRTGRWIIDHHAVPTVDVSSWTRYNHPWIVHEWGMCVLLWEVFHLFGGYAAVWFLEWLLLSVTFIALFYRVWIETGRATLTAFILVLWAAKMTGPLVSPRPHLVSYLCLVLMFWLILDARRDTRSLRRLWLLPLIFAIWANFHAAVVVGVGLLFTIAICDAIDAWFLRSHDPERSANMMRFAKQAGVVGIVSAAAMLLNPYGWHLFDIFAQTVGDKIMPTFVSEWRALDFHSPFGYIFEVLLALFVLGLSMSRERRDLSEIVLIIALTHAGFTANRNVPIFGIVGVLICGRHIQSALAASLGIGSAKADKSPSLLGPAPLLAPLAIVTVCIFLQTMMFVAQDLKDSTSQSRNSLQRFIWYAYARDNYPWNACTFMKREQIPAEAKLYNFYPWGAFITWVAPERRVSISTQTDVFFGDVLKDYADMDGQPYNWRSTLGKYNPDVVLLPAQGSQAWLFMTAPEWALVYLDNPDPDDDKSINAAIFIRRESRYADLIERCRRDCPALHGQSSNDIVYGINITH